MNPDPKTITLLGGTGFIGSRLCARLASDGHALRVITRQRNRARHLLVLPKIKLIEGDLFDEATLDSAATGADVVVNLVGILNERGDDGSGFEKAHVGVTRAALEACQRLDIGRYLHMSALNASKDAPSHYLRSKANAEALLTNSGISWSVFRPSVVFGPGDSFFNRFAALLRLTPWVFPLAAAHARFAPVFVDDVVGAFTAATDRRDTVGRAYDLCGPEIYTLKELVAYTARRIGKPCHIIELSETLANLQASILEHVPGKPLSRDNLRSLSVDSICRGAAPGLAELGIDAAALTTIVPQYLHEAEPGGRYGGYRERAGRR